MKSAVNKGGPVSTPVLSHIPLPRRKSSSKSDKGLELNDTDSELGSDSTATRSQAKMSLLSGTSFCCASGQKEDYLPEAKIIPPRKRPPNVSAKQVHDSSTPNTPLVPPTSKGLLKNRRGRIIECNSDDTLSLTSESGLVKLSHEDIKIRPLGDSRLRPPDQRGRITPSSPQRKISRDPLPFHRENSDTKKSSDVIRKMRKDASPRMIPKENPGGKKLKDNTEALDNCPPKEIGPRIKSSNKISTSKSGNSESNSRVCNGSINLFQPDGDALEKIDQAKNSTYSVCDASGMLPNSDTQDSIDSGVNNSTSFDKSSDVVHSPRHNTQDGMDSIMTDSDIMKNSHESNQFDCPCCDKSLTLVDGPMSDTEIHVFTSCEVVATPCQNVQTEDIMHKELALQSEVKSLKEDLQAERMKLKTQQDQVQHLEEELVMMGQLKNELEKEKELRKIAEDKLLEVLDHEKRIDAQRRENEKRMESKGTQKDDPEISGNSPLMMGYESRVRRYQTYITKLEKDNLSLVNELKKFKDLSPSSQEDQAKLLIEKLGEIQRNSHQQQLQYESCLDEVANRLVHTLLVQKRLEEECKVLHLRVEQLEQENGTLMELIDDDKNENVIKTPTDEEINFESTISKVQNKLPSHHSVTSSPAKKNSTTHKPSISSDEKITEPQRSTNACTVKSSEPKSPVTSPVSPSSKTGCTSKIPAFGSSKPVVVRKKSKTESQPAKPRNEVHPREPTSPSTVPNIKMPSSIPSSRTKMPINSETPKGTSVKRKRLSRNSSPAEKAMKDSKQRMKTSHMRWEQRKTVPEDLASLCKSSKGEISPIETFPRQPQIWSFNCEVDNEITIPESSQKIADSINVFHKNLDEEGNERTDEIDKLNLNTSDVSSSIDGVNRTRDEGYSTMSSDLQPDSAADTTVSEPEHSATYIVTEKDLRSVSEDSVTECLDGSMCSSSDSGFGPLHLVANSKSSADLLEEGSKVKEPSKSAQDFPRNISTVRHKEQIASVKPTIRNNSPSKLPSENELCNKPKSFCDNFINSDPSSITQIKNSTDELKLSPLKSRNILDNIDIPLQSSSPHKKFDYISMLDYWGYPKDILDITSHGKTWHLGPKKSSKDDQIVFCSRHSYIDDNIFDEKVETAEKATLTEPEEAMWREKALAPFIDESIWSLYSSEGDIRVKHFPLEPLLSEPSLDRLITECRPCIIITEDVDGSAQSDFSEFPKPLLTKTSNNSSAADLSDSCEKFRSSGLERVASDTVLYLKDAIHELEDSMHRGLKSSKNVSALHNNSGSESEASPSSFKPELLLNLETAMLGQNRLVWPSPTRSSSTSSLQSSTSFQVVSDEMDDVDLLRTSRKGSQDPDLSSASDAEDENLEHKDFVERWLQNEVTHSNSSKIMVSQLEPVEEAVESTPPPIRRTSLPLPVSPPGVPRARFMSYPQTTDSFIKLKLDSSKCDFSSSTSPADQNYVEHTINDSIEDVEFKGVDSEVKEFNGDFYKLCSVGSLRSLDHFSPAKSRDAQKRLKSESPSLNRKPSGLANLLLNSEKPKPTGLVKPTRPISLVVSNVPQVPDHLRSNSQSPRNNKNITASTNLDKKAKTTQVPQKFHHSVFQKQSSPRSTSLPTAADEQNSNCKSPKVKVPTKIVFKSSASRRRQHNRKDAINERQNQLKEGCGTAWIHLQANPELSDPTARINFLDSIKAPTSSSGSSSDEEEEEEVLIIQTNSHLHRICRERRQKVKASANNLLYDGKKRSSIMGRRELFYRFGDKEKEAIACFDFLEELPTSSIETLNMLNSSSPHELLPIHRTATPPSDLYPAGRESLSHKERISFLSPTASNKLATFGNQSSISRSPFSSYKRMRLPNLWNQPLSHNMSSSTLNSQDCELLDHISLSDSCAESYSSTPESYEDAS